MIAVAGIALVVLGTSLPIVIAGFAALGFGVSLVSPLSATAAAARGDRPAALNVGALSLGAFAAFMVGPPLTGFVADAWGLRAGLATIIPLVALTALLAGEVHRRASSQWLEESVQAAGDTLDGVVAAALSVVSIEPTRWLSCAIAPRGRRVGSA